MSARPYTITIVIAIAVHLKDQSLGSKDPLRLFLGRRVWLGCVQVWHQASAASTISITILILCYACLSSILLLPSVLPLLQSGPCLIAVAQITASRRRPNYLPYNLLLSACRFPSVTVCFACSVQLPVPCSLFPAPAKAQFDHRDPVSSFTVSAHLFYHYFHPHLLFLLYHSQFFIVADICIYVFILAAAEIQSGLIHLLPRRSTVGQIKSP